MDPMTEDEPVRLLLVEDSEDDATLVLHELRRHGFRVHSSRVETEQALAKALADADWDLVVSDHNLPQFSAPEALKVVQQKARDLPFIVVSGSIGEDRAVAAMKAGAQDYLMKSNLARLGPAVRRVLSDAEQRRRRESAEDRLREAEEQLRQAQKMEAIGQLAGGIAHDFNNLLAAMLLFAGFVRDSLPEGDARRDDIIQVLDAGDRAVSLTRQLLTFSRRQPSSKRPTDVRQNLAQLGRLLTRTVGEHIDVAISAPPHPVVVRIDPVQFDQVVLNLAVNGRDAMAHGGRLTIELDSIPDARQDGGVTGHASMRLTVSDTGVGMDDATQLRIFEPFFTTKKPGQGTGLGLATCFGIVGDAGGSIRVASTPGQGSTFTVTLPLCDEPAVAPESAIPVRATGHGETVLVVEDEPSLRTVTARVLANAGYRVRTAAGPEEAIRALNDLRASVDVVLSDVVMPGGSGYDVAKYAALAAPSAAVILTSGHVAEFAPEHPSMDLPILWKPVSAGNLVQAVERALARARDAVPALTEQGTTVLLVEDNESWRNAMTRLLTGGGYAVEAAGSIAEARSRLARGQRPWAVICDLSLPDGSGGDLLHWMRNACPELRSRTIVLTGGVLDDAGRSIAESGEWPVLPKSGDPRHLLDRLAALTAGTTSPAPPPAVMVDRQSPAGAAPQAPAVRGGGASRVLLTEDDRAAASAIARVLRQDGLSVDVAHTLGDARRLLGTGGFDALVTDIGLPDGNALEMLQDLRGKNLDLPVVMLTGAPSVTSATTALRGRVNEYLCKPVSAPEVVRAVRAAITAGRIARLRNKLLSMRSGGHDFVRDLPGTEARFESALTRLHLVYQPIVRAADGSVYACEALLRCHEPTLASPLRLLAAAEVLERVDELGRVVRAIVAKTLDEHPGADALVFVNVHPSEFRADVLTDPTDPLIEHADRVVFEVTERASLQSGAQLAADVEAIRGVGYRLAVDDLGEGYSGLASLIQLRPDVAKIDMSLVRDIDSEPLKRDIVAAIVEMARASNIQVVAEGIETAAERDTVVALGCELLQGHFLGVPGPSLSRWSPEPACSGANP